MFLCRHAGGVGQSTRYIIPIGSAQPPLDDGILHRASSTADAKSTICWHLPGSASNKVGWTLKSRARSRSNGRCQGGWEAEVGR